ncbi:hypothetical protein [Bernardetia sp.]|uniref:hypothetical protein n=1 Tax=Bernardetia sp. TaxID=1937974 RepID=UPI0025B90A01|nr:hypothetical protein [Bernardetia sp.]
MKATTFLHLFKNDIRNILRDKTLLMMLFFPFMLIFGLKAGLPSLNKLLPQFPDYYGLALAVLATTSGMLGGYIISFVMLDEKDENVFTVIRVMPFSMIWFISYRLLLAGFWAFCFAFLSFVALDINDYSLVEKLLYSLFCSQTAVVVLLFLVTFANDKIEGITFIKGTNFFTVLPVLAFLVDSSWKHIFSIFPFYWTYKAMQEPNFLWILISIISHFIFFLLGYFFFLKKVK